MRESEREREKWSFHVWIARSFCGCQWGRGGFDDVSQFDEATGNYKPVPYDADVFKKIE
jgi:hypothetical protein